CFRFCAVERGQPLPFRYVQNKASQTKPTGMHQGTRGHKRTFSCARMLHGKTPAAAIKRPSTTAIAMISRGLRLMPTISDRIKDLTRKSSATAGGSECSKLTEFFHKSNMRIGTASGWLQRLVRRIQFSEAGRRILCRR